MKQGYRGEFPLHKPVILPLLFDSSMFPSLGFCLLILSSSLLQALAIGEQST